MAAFCGKCGTPLGASGKFCPSCGTPRPADVPAQPAVTPQQQASADPVQTIPAKSGMSAVKILLVVLVLGFGAVVLAGVGAVYFGKRKLDAWRQNSSFARATRPDSAAGTPSGARSASSRGGENSLLLSKEEVGAIIGVPITSIEMQGKHDAHYKTDTMGMEASIEVEQKDGEADAVQSMAAARTVTKNMFGGKGAPEAALGDEAVFGAFNVLYVRKNDLFFTIMPPNLKQVAQMKQYNDMTSQPMGSDAQVKSLQKLADLQKGDPVAGSLAKPDAMSGAVDLIRHAGTEQGDEYETKSRAMARQMAEKVLAKL
jgi:hypothetical protein